MARSFLGRRLLSSLVAVFGVSVLVFLLVHLIPGDPVDNLLGELDEAPGKLVEGELIARGVDERHVTGRWRDHLLRT